MQLRNNFDKIMNEPLKHYQDTKLQPLVNELKFKEEYQSNIIKAMTNGLDDSYVTTPIHEYKTLKLDNSKEGVVKVPKVIGETLLNHITSSYNTDNQLPVVKEVQNIKANTIYSLVSNNNKTDAVWTKKGLDVVGDGLVCWLDGMDATTTSWKDRVRGIEFEMKNITKSNLVENKVHFNNNSYAVYNNEILNTNDNYTIIINYDNVSFNGHADCLAFFGNSYTGGTMLIASNRPSAAIRHEQGTSNSSLPVSEIANNLQVAYIFRSDKIYIAYMNENKIISKSPEVPSKLRTTMAPIHIASELGTKSFINKRISSIKMYNRALTDSELLQNYEYEEVLMRKHMDRNNEINVLKSPLDITDISVLLEGEGTSKDIMLLEGDWRNKPIPNFFQNFSSTGEAENNKLIHKVNNKNLLDLRKEDIRRANYGFGFPQETNSPIAYEVLPNGDLKLTTANNAYNTGICFYKKLKRNTTYVLSGIEELRQHTMSFKTFLCKKSDIPVKELIKEIPRLSSTEVMGGSKVSLSFNTMDYEYVMFYIGGAWVENAVGTKSYHFKNLMLEESSTASNYVEPLVNTSEVVINEPLRYINSDCYDEIVGNKIIRRVGKKVFNGNKNEIWQAKENFSNEKYLQFLTYLDVIDKTNNNPISICNFFKNVQYIWNVNEVGFTYQQSVSNGKDIVWIKVLREEFPTVEKFKEFLSEHPVEIMHSLIEPIEEELIAPIALQGYNDCSVTVENNIMPTVSYKYNALVPYKEELKKQSREVGVNILDVNANIVPYLMDMEFALLELETGV